MTVTQKAVEALELQLMVKIEQLKNIISHDHEDYRLLHLIRLQVESHYWTFMMVAIDDMSKRHGLSE